MMTDNINFLRLLNLSLTTPEGEEHLQGQVKQAEGSWSSRTTPGSFDLQFCRPAGASSRFALTRGSRGWSGNASPVSV